MFEYTKIYTIPVSKAIIYVSGIDFTLVLLYFHTKANIVTDFVKIHNKQQIQTLSSHHLVFLLIFGEPPKCKKNITLTGGGWTIDV